MKRTLSNVLLFAAGAAIGAAITWKYFKAKYELVEEDWFDEGDDEDEEDPEDAGKSTVESDVQTQSNTISKKPSLKEAYAERVKQLGYSDATANAEEDEDVYEPYIIRPEEYGELHAYETLSLNYYADGVLTDDLDNRIEDVESMVPADFADHFGEYEDDSVFVRSDERQCDYEILRDKRKFSDVIGDALYPLEDE